MISTTLSGSLQMVCGALSSTSARPVLLRFPSLIAAAAEHVTRAAAAGDTFSAHANCEHRSMLPGDAMATDPQQQLVGRLADAQTYPCVLAADGYVACRSGSRNKGRQSILLPLVCNACDLIRHVPAFREGGTMAAVVQLYESSRSNPALAQVPSTFRAMLALQLVRTAPVFWAVRSPLLFAKAAPFVSPGPSSVHL